jgi:L-threonylcarbamoyladenylate synthase
VPRTYDCSDADERRRGLTAAAGTVRGGGVVVLPTDTVYGVGTDAFSASGVAALLEAKGRGRDMPVPVLVASPKVLDGVAWLTSAAGRDLVDAFWPGALTLVCREQPSLAWDLGDTHGTVAVRMPLHPVAVALLTDTGPMAVSSANRTGSPPPSTCAAAEEQLGDAVEVYLDAGPSGDPLPSSIVDVTGDVPVLLREGALDLATLQSVVPEMVMRT